MSTDTQDVLSLLPELFPGTQQIPLGHIRPNPENPGAPIPEEEVTDLAENLSVTDLLNPIKVMPDPAGPLTRGVALHPENPRLRGDGQPWALADFKWLILAGEGRWRAFGRLKREAIPATILNPSPQDMAEIIRIDNAIRDRGWFADYQSIESLKKANPQLPQREVATRLKIPLPKVNRAVGLLPLLNPESRALLVTISNTQNKGIRGFSEIAAAELAGLGTDPITPETQDLVRRALAVAIDHEMTQAKVKNLVQWVKQGNKPEDYSDKGFVQAQPGPAIPQASSQAAGSPMEPAQPRHEPRLDASAQVPLSSRIGAGASMKIFGDHIRQSKSKLGSLLPRFVNRFIRVYDWLNSWFQKRGVKNPVYASALAAFVILFVGTFIIGKVTHYIGRALLYATYYRLGVSKDQDSNPPATQTAAQGPANVGGTVTQNSPTSNQPSGLSGAAQAIPAASNVQAGSNPQGSNPLVASNGTVASQSGASASGQDKVNVLAVASGQVQGVSMQGHLESNSVSLSPQWSGKVAGVDVSQVRLAGINLPLGGNPSSGGVSNSKFLIPHSRAVPEHEPYVPEELEQRVKDDKDQAQKLAELFYGFSYQHNFEHWRERFDCLAKDYEDDFDAQYFTQERQDDFKENQKYYDFDPSGPPRLVSLSDNEDDVRVEGTVTLRSDADYSKKKLSQKHEALVVTFFHNPDNSWAVTGIKETPAP